MIPPTCRGLGAQEGGTAGTASLPNLSGHLSDGAIHIFTQDPADLQPCSRKVCTAVIRARSGHLDRRQSC